MHRRLKGMKPEPTGSQEDVQMTDKTRDFMTAVLLKLLDSRHSHPSIMNKSRSTSRSPLASARPSALRVERRRGRRSSGRAPRLTIMALYEVRDSCLAHAGRTAAQSPKATC